MQIGSKRPLNPDIEDGEPRTSNSYHHTNSTIKAAMPKTRWRPYECVRRAWHNDRHKPLRGSIIQHIFRLVGEAHGDKIKSNREWQEKLPIVVLKCEEILYSKANTEGEYLDQGTLWVRVSDAVNTIIRLDEVNEQGKLLPPCVEAALTLGCVPVKASRSQRHCNTQTYLRPKMQDQSAVALHVPLRINDNVTSQQCQRSVYGSSSLSIPDQNIGMTNEPSNFALPRKSFHFGAQQSVPVEASDPLSFGSVYPLYHTTNSQFEDRLVGIKRQKCNYIDSHKILMGRPLTRLVPRPTSTTKFMSILPKDTAENTVLAVTQPCDLSLRLGLSPSLEVDREMNCCLDFYSRRHSEDTNSAGGSNVINNLTIFHNFMEDGHFSGSQSHCESRSQVQKTWPDF